MSTPRIRMPATARPGEPVEIRTLIDHPMETGLRQQGGQTVRRRMITRFEAAAEGETIVSADFRNGTSANPFLVFTARFERDTVVTFTWTQEDGAVFTASQRIAVR